MAVIRASIISSSPSGHGAERGAVPPHAQRRRCGVIPNGGRHMFTLIDDGTVHEIDATVDDGRVLLSPAGLAEIGWELHPEGLCREGLCVPVPADAALEVGEHVDLAALARVLDRPLAIDADEGTAYLGVSAGERARALRSL